MLYVFKTFVSLLSRHASHKRTSLFLAVTQRVVVIPYRRTPVGSHM